MESLQGLHEKYLWVVIVIGILAVWDSVWKMVGMWKAARNKQATWFICIGVINTIGILPIVYILTHRNRGEEKA